MKVTGTQLKTALNTWSERKSALEKLLKDNVWSFEPVSENSPKNIVNIQNHLAKAVEAVCSLQEAQQLYNAQISVTVKDADGNPKFVSLSFAVKMVGELGAMKAQWRRISLDNGREDRYSRTQLQRSADELFAKKTVSDEVAYKISSDLGKQAGEYRDAMARGNASEIEIDLDASLLNPPTTLL